MAYGFLLYYLLSISSLGESALGCQDVFEYMTLQDKNVRKKVADMIDQDKLKTMSQLALYEKKKGKKDLNIYSYEEGDYIRFQGLKTLILVTFAFVAVVGLIMVWNMDYLMNHFVELNYGLLIGLVCGALLLVLVFYMILSYRKSKEEYNSMNPRVRRYQRKLKKMRDFYMREDKKQRDFEKGEWRNGQ